MSFILEALKKAEAERRQGLTATSDPAAPAEEPKPGRRRGLLLLLALALLVNTALLAWWLKPWAEAPAPLPAPVVTAQAEPLPAVAETATPTPEASAQSVAAAEPASASADRPAEPAVQEKSVPAQEAASIPETAPVQPIVDVRETTPATKPAAAAKPSAVQSGAETPAVVAYRELSPADRARIPEIDLQLHYYTAAKERRLVRINDVNLHEGEGTGGLRVDEILPDGMILESGAVKFFYPASRR
jgi:general secretion pathway protein B